LIDFLFLSFLISCLACCRRQHYMSCLVKLSLSFFLVYIYMCYLNVIKQASKWIVLPHKSHSFKLASERVVSAAVCRHSGHRFNRQLQGFVRLEERNPAQLTAWPEAPPRATSVLAKHRRVTTTCHLSVARIARIRYRPSRRTLLSPYQPSVFGFGTSLCDLVPSSSLSFSFSLICEWKWPRLAQCFHFSELSPSQQQSSTGKITYLGLL